MAKRYQKQEGWLVEMHVISGSLALDALARQTDVGASTAWDLAILSDAVVGRACAQAYLKAEHCYAVAQSGIAVAVPAHREDVQAPDIATQAGLCRILLGADRIAISTGPSGRHLRQCFNEWGLTQALDGRFIVAPPGTPVAQLLRAGLASIGFQQMSELIDAPGIRILGALPQSLQKITIFAAAMTGTCRSPERAVQFLQALCGPEAAAILPQYGLKSCSPQIVSPR